MPKSNKILFYLLINMLICILLRYCPSCSLIDAPSVRVKENLYLLIAVLGVAIGTTNQPHADESGDMLASSRVPDVDVYADVTALKLSHVFRTELSSLEAT